MSYLWVLFYILFLNSSMKVGRAYFSLHCEVTTPSIFLENLFFQKGTLFQWCSKLTKMVIKIGSTEKHKVRVTVLGTTIFHTDNIENHLKGIFT